MIVGQTELHCMSVPSVLPADPQLGAFTSPISSHLISSELNGTVFVSKSGRCSVQFR